MLLFVVVQVARCRNFNGDPIHYQASAQANETQLSVIVESRSRCFKRKLGSMRC